MAGGKSCCYQGQILFSHENQELKDRSFHGVLACCDALFLTCSLWFMLAELADLPLIRLDFSCNKITEIPAAYRKLRQLQHIILDNNPMQSPPAQASSSTA